MCDGVHGERPARIDDDHVDRGRELPAEDSDGRLPRSYAPGRTAVGRGVDAAAEPPGAARDDTRVGDRAVARRERESSHPDRSRDAARLAPGAAAVVARVEPRPGPRAVDADEDTAAVRRHREGADGTLRRDVGGRVGRGEGECAGERRDQCPAELHAPLRKPSPEAPSGPAARLPRAAGSRRRHRRRP